MKNSWKISSQGTIEPQESHQPKKQNMKILDSCLQKWCAACGEGCGIGGRHRLQLVDEVE